MSNEKQSDEIEAGQEWYGLRPGAYSIIRVRIKEVTPKTVNLVTGLCGDGLFTPIQEIEERFVRGDFEFIERINPKEAS